MRIFSKNCINSDVQQWRVKKDAFYSGTVQEVRGICYASYNGSPYFTGSAQTREEGYTAAKNYKITSMKQSNQSKDIQSLGLQYSFDIPTADGAATMDNPIYVDGYFYYYTSSGIKRTSDFATAEEVYHDYNASIRGLAYGNEIFAAIIDEHNNPHVVTSSDGENWSTVSTLPASGIGNILYLNNQFVLYPCNGGIATSVDCTSWTQYNVPFSYFSLLSYGDGKYVIITSSGQYSISADLVNWSNLKNITNDLSNYFVARQIIYNGKEFCTVGYSRDAQTFQYTGVIATTKDGTNWNCFYTPNAEWYTVAFGERMFSVVGRSANDYKLLCARKRI